MPVAYKQLHYEKYEDVQSYFETLYQHVEGQFKLIVKTRDGITNLSDLDRLKVIYNLDGVDLMMSIGLYKNKNDVTHRESNLVNLPLFCIDLDHEEGFHWQQIFKGIVKYTGLPAPNYIEYGHRCRFIYILREPLQLSGPRKQKLLSGYKFLGKCFCQLINEEFPCYGAEPQLPTSFIRVPGSYNSKGGVIKVEHIWDKQYTLQELFEFIPPDLIDKSGNAEEWKDTWVEKKKKKKVVRVHNPYQLWAERRQWLDEIQQEVPNREEFLFVYSQALLWMNEYSLQELLKVNDRFDDPLPEREVESKFRTITKYKLSNEAIEERTGFEMSRQMEYYARLRKKQIAEGKAKFQELERNRLAIRACKEEGLSQSKTAAKLGLDINKVKRAWNRTEPYTA